MQELIWVNLGIADAIDFERCHRIPAPMNSSKNQNHPWTIICKVTKFKDKQKILKYAKCQKDTGIFIYEDFCKDITDLQKKLWNKISEYRK